MIIATRLARVASRTILQAKRMSPDILIVGGVVAVAASGYMLHKAAVKNSVNVQATVSSLEELRTHLDTDNITNEEFASARSRNIFSLVKVTAKNYAPALTVGVLGVASILGGYKILRGRYVAVAAAYTALDGAYGKYRATVQEMLGADGETKIANALSAVSRNVVDEDGKSVEYTDHESSELSPYARFFDETNIQWQRQPSYNLNFLRAQEAYWNNRLQSRGHVFLNEVYDSLGFEHSSAGALVGWIAGQGDSYISFGIDDDNLLVREAVNNGGRSAILIDPNVDGLIYDLI